MKPSQKILLTGIKPTGTPHVGNYVGAIEPAIKLVSEYEHSFLFIADYHALNSVQNGARLHDLTYALAATWLACGLDPSKTIMYRQSAVPEVFELETILNAITPKGWMNKAHAYKAVVEVNEADQRSLDRIKTDELDAFRIAIYCEQNHKKILRNPSKLPSPVYFKLKRLLAERKQNTKQSVLYKQQLHDICAYDTDLSVERKKLLLKNMQENQKAIDKEIDSYMNEDTSIRKNYNLLTSIPGIGRIIALETIVLTENFTAISNHRIFLCKRATHRGQIFL
jgi:tryptophanyl-tRNA synthetase